MTALAYITEYPGSAITVARLGLIEVGRIHTEGKRASWMCHLPPAWACQWRKARSYAEAAQALEERVARWVAEAGLKGGVDI